MIEFLDGHSMTFEEAAALIRKEGRLSIGLFFGGNNMRCTWAVIRGLTSPIAANPIRIASYRSMELAVGTAINDCFRGTPEARAEFMAQRFDQLAAGVLPSEVH